MISPTSNSLTLAAQSPDAAAFSSGSQAARLSPQEREALQQFEAIFLRQLLGSLEKAGTFAGKSGGSAGSGIYGSMMVGAMADAAANAGGIGLVNLFAEQLHPQTPTAEKLPSGASPSPIKIQKSG